MPGVAAIASRLASAVRVSIIASVTVSVLARGQIILLVGDAGEHTGAVRTPAALAERWKFCRRGEGTRIGGCVDHGCDDTFRPEVEHATHQRKISERHAHDRRGAGLPYGGDARDEPGHVPHAMLAVERHRGEAFTGDDLGDNRRGQAAPAGVHGLAGAQTGGE